MYENYSKPGRPSVCWLIRTSAADMLLRLINAGGLVLLSKKAVLRFRKMGCGITITDNR